MLARFIEALQNKPLDLLENNYFRKYGMIVSKVPFLVKLLTKKDSITVTFMETVGHFLNRFSTEHLRGTASVLPIDGKFVLISVYVSFAISLVS